MATRRAKSAGGRSQAQLFRGSVSPDTSTDDDTMQVDTEVGSAPEGDTTIAMPTTAAGDNLNIAPVLDEGGQAETSSTSSSKRSTAVKDKDEETNDTTTSQNDNGLLASLPVYYSTSLPSTSSLQIFQYPTYSRGLPLPVPESALSRNMREAIRYRPKAKRVEVELPLDLRPTVYDHEENGPAMAKGAAAGGTIGQGEASTKVKKEVKREYGTDHGSTNRLGGTEKRLEKTRLESSLIPHQTQYMVGVIRDKALHLTPVDSIVQLRPSMHYLDALDAMAQQEKRKSQAEPGEETDDGSMTEDGGAAANARAKEKKKAQSLSVSILGDAGGGPLGARGKGGVADSRDLLMLADRQAEGERWIDLDWKGEKTDESKKTFDAQLFASSKTPLECKTRPREFLEYTA